jgi:predicted kinase
MSRSRRGVAPTARRAYAISRHTLTSRSGNGSAQIVLRGVYFQQVMLLNVPEPALVLLIGPSGSGKSTFAAAHFKPTEILSSDWMRAMVADDASDQDASAEAFRVLAIFANGRLKRRLTTVIDATNLRAANRKKFRQVAARYGVPTVAVLFDFDPATYATLNSGRADRVVEEEIVADQASRMRDAMASVPLEGYARLYVFRDPSLVRLATVERA